MSPTRFGIFELDTTSGELRKRGVKVRLPEQVYRVLNTLLEHPGEVVSRERLKESVWPDRTFVDFESALNKCISQLRTILGDSGHNPRFVETLSKRGYRFIAPIQPTRRDDSSRSIVVLPLDSPIDHGVQSYLAAGVTDMLTTALGEVRLLESFRNLGHTFVTSSKLAICTRPRAGRGPGRGRLGDTAGACDLRDCPPRKHPVRARGLARAGPMRDWAVCRSCAVRWFRRSPPSSICRLVPPGRPSRPWPPSRQSPAC